MIPARAPAREQAVSSRMKTFARLLALLGLSLVVLASPGQENRSLRGFERLPAAEPTPDESPVRDPVTGLVPLQTLAGADHCPGTPISALPFTDSGPTVTTVGTSNDSTGFLKQSCAEPTDLFSRLGPD